MNRNQYRNRSSNLVQNVYADNSQNEWKPAGQTWAIRGRRIETNVKYNSKSNQESSPSKET